MRSRLGGSRASPLRRPRPVPAGTNTRPRAWGRAGEPAPFLRVRIRDSERRIAERVREEWPEIGGLSFLEQRKHVRDCSSREARSEETDEQRDRYRGQHGHLPPEKGF